MHAPHLFAALSIAGLVSADGIYTKNSPVLQVTAKTYDSLIAQSNHTSILEFYAPWCGHCQNLKPVYEKAAKNLAGLAKVAAIDCDDDANKPFCGQMGIKGFPTLKIVKPGSKPGRPVVEDYQGPRSAKAIVDAVADKIPNHVKRIQDSGLDAWLEDKTVVAKAILFTDKGTTGALIKALAVDFLGNIDFAQVRNKEKKAIEKFNVKTYPTVVLVPEAGQDPITYDGDMRKEGLSQFFSQVAPPNPDPAPKKATTSTAKKAKSANSAASSKFAKASEAHKSSDFQDHMQAKGTTVVEDDVPIDSPLPIVEPNEKPLVVKEAAPAIPQLPNAKDLEVACLDPKSGNCILVLLPKAAEADTTLPPIVEQALSSFADIAAKHRNRNANIFPFYAIPASNDASSIVRKSLKLKAETELEIVVVNKKRKSWRHFSADAYDAVSVENFIDQIKLGEGSKQKLPPDFFAQADTTPQAEPEPTPVPEPETEADASSAADPEPAATATHRDEL